MKKKLEKGLILLSQGWFGITNPFSSAFETYEGATGKVVQLINFAISAAAVVAVAVIIYGGYTYITSEGDDEKIAGAQATITTGIIGLGVAFVSGIVVRFVADNLLR